MEKLFPESLVDFETIVSPISSESRTASSTGIHKNRNTNRVKATESVLWSNRGDSSVKIDQPTVPITNNSNSTLTESIQEDKVQEICQNKVSVPRKKGIKRRQVQIGPNIDEDKAIQQNDSINEHGINECACYPAEFCAMKGLDVSKSLHKCCKCHAKIFAVCAPQFEETSEVRCRHCTISNNITAQPKEINKKIIDKKTQNIKRNDVISKMRIVIATVIKKMLAIKHALQLCQVETMFEDRCPELPPFARLRRVQSYSMVPRTITMSHTYSSNLKYTG